MNILTDTNIITYCCTALVILGLVIGMRLLTAVGKRPNSSYNEFPMTNKNDKRMFKG